MSEEPPVEGPARRDWRDSVRTAADLAIVGFAVTLAALPVLTAGAAVATASVAVRHFLEYDQWPPASSIVGTFRRRLVSGLLAGPAALVAAVLIVLDVQTLRRGLVPGGPLVLSAVLVVAALAAGYAALLAVLAGTRPSGAARAAATLAAAHPALLAAATGVVAVAAVLALFIHPALTPVLPGYALFGLHVVARRSVPGVLIPGVADRA
jgi:hypothetical protein